MNRYVRALLSVISVFAMLLLTPATARAFDWHSTDSIQLPQGEVSDGSYYAFGDNIIIDGEVRGDLICAGRQITVNGIVDGDILCAGQSLDINGLVKGDVRAAGQTVQITNTVNGNVHTAAQIFELSSGAVIKGELAYGAQSATLAGKVGQDLLGGSDKLSLAGEFDKNLYLGVSSISLDPSAKINGNLNYYSDRSIDLNQDQIRGGVAFHQVEKPQKPQVRNWAAEWFAKRVWSIVSSLIVVGMLVWLYPEKLELAIKAMLKKPGKNFLLGFATIVLAPMLLLVLALTLVGIPLAFILGGLLFLGVAIARFVPAVWIGQQLLGTFKHSAKLWQSALVGVTISWLAFGLPFWGFWLSAFSCFIGLGTIITVCRKLDK